MSAALDHTPSVTICEKSSNSSNGRREGALPLPSVPEYLDSTVMAVLTEGLEDLCRQRPANPVDHLALFLLRRSQSNTAIEVAPKDAVPVEPVKEQH
ncbi:Dpy-30 motif [Trypanosoma melophagium]|uniref:Dpy-30 motif n=1 Tax=Trypanosoma melophagium TaxID=715481 RepID=UPI00351AA252|nr:Dpy-30 motif [Trypanosoma melophagium]